MFHCKSLNKQSSAYCQIGKGQQKRVIAYITFVRLKSFLLLCAKRQGHLTHGSREALYRVFTINEHYSQLLGM